MTRSTAACSTRRRTACSTATRAGCARRHHSWGSVPRRTARRWARVRLLRISRPTHSVPACKHNPCACDSSSGRLVLSAGWSLVCYSTRNEVFFPTCSSVFCFFLFLPQRFLGFCSRARTPLKRSKSVKSQNQPSTAPGTSLVLSGMPPGQGDASFILARRGVRRCTQYSSVQPRVYSIHSCTHATRLLRGAVAPVRGFWVHFSGHARVT